MGFVPKIVCSVLTCGLMVTTSLRAAAPDLAGDGTDPESGVIIVRGEKPVSEASAGTKSAVPIAETPQSVSVVDSSRIAGLGLQNLNQALRFVAGVTPEQRGASEEIYDLFKLRGFDALIYLDGLRQFVSPTGYATAQTDVSRLDRIEVVKGPASTLYGQSTPGGIIAQASKLPLDQDLYGAVAGTYGTFNLYRVDGDIGGRAGPGVLWRLYGSANGADVQQRFGKRERQTVSGAVTLGANGATSLTLLGNYSHDPYNGTYGVFPALGTLLPNPNGRISSRFDGGEAGNRYRRNQASGTYILTHDFGDGWAFRASGRLQRVTSKLGLVYTSGGLATAGGVPDPAQRLYARASYSTDERLNAWTYDNQLTGRFETGPLTHDVLVGYDRQLIHSREAGAFGSAPSIDAYAPIYGTFVVPRTPAQVPDVTYGGYLALNSLQQGVYAQDQIAWEGLRLTLSGRQDWTRIDNGAGATTSPASVVFAARQRNRKFTWRAGALYKLDMGLAPYVSYATSFQPQTATVLNADGSFGLAKPSTGRQIEAGLKYQVPGTGILVTAAWFHIIQNDVVTSNPVTFVSYQSGKVRSKGVEIEATVPLPHGFDARFAFSQQRVKVLEDADPARVGKSLETVGKGNLSANLEWSPVRGPLQGLVLGGAVRHVSPVYAGIAIYDGVARYSPAYTLFDALARYDLGGVSERLRGVSVAVNATNLFNKRYLTSCYSNYGWCWYGSRRTVQGTIGYRF